MKNEIWLNMDNIKKRKYNNSIWIPLKKTEIILEEGKYGYDGYKKEIDYVNSVMIDISKKEVVNIDWNTLNLKIFKGYVGYKKYIQSDLITDYKENEIGISPILAQETIRKNFHCWYLHQDLILTLGLEKENNIWICPEYGYEEVIKERKDSTGKVIAIEIKAEYLKDYLAARNMGLCILNYSERTTFSLEKTEEESFKNDNSSLTWKKYSRKIIEGGKTLGDIFIQKVSRTDVDKEEDMPMLSNEITEENIKSETKLIKPKGKIIFYNQSRLWKREWIDPANKSPKVRGDIIKANVFFKIDELGNALADEDLKNSGKWLWFEPELINVILKKRGTSLIFYTRYTGNLECSYGYNLHFGVNKSGKINIFSEDVAILPKWIQNILVAYNITPEGKVSHELLMSQVDAEPSPTKACEEHLKDLYQMLNSIFEKKFSFSFFKENNLIEEILRKINRFRAINEEGILSLAKDLSRILIEPIDTNKLKDFFQIKDKKIASLKTIEEILKIRVSDEKAYEIMSPIHAIYELRQGDAHLYNRNPNVAFEILNINKEEPSIEIGEKLIYQSCKWLYTLYHIIKNLF